MCFHKMGILSRRLGEVYFLKEHGTGVLSRRQFPFLGGIRHGTFWGRGDGCMAHMYFLLTNIVHTSNDTVSTSCWSTISVQ